MCISHDPKLLKEWLPKKPFKAYKVIFEGNHSVIFSKKWSVGKHRTPVSRLSNGKSSSGFYVYLDRQAATNNALIGRKMICVYIDPKDVVYAGRQNAFDTGSCRVLVCRRIEVKSLKGLKT